MERETEELYRRYRADVEGDRMVRSTRTGAPAVALLNTLFIPLDWFVFPERFGWMLALRLFCNAAMGVVYFRTGRTRPVASAIAGCLLVGLMLLAVIGAAGGVTSDYVPGLMLLLLGIPVLLPFSAYQAAAISSVLLGGLALLPIFADPVGIEAYLLSMIFPVAAGLESVVACYLLDRLRFSDYCRERELETAHEKLKQLDVEKARFTANVHHELRTPLTLMLAPIEALLNGDFGSVSELQKGYFQTMHSNGLRLLKLINNLLDLAKLESQQLQVTRRPLELQNLVEELVTSARPLAERKGVALEASRFQELPVIHADRDALEKVVVNLLGNALKFTEAGGRIDVTGAALPDGGVEIVVADTGIGLPPDELGRIFDRFAQVDSSNTRRHEGTGIGLALVKELVELHGGGIRAESEGIGRGARMIVRLPVGEPDDDAFEEVLTSDEGASLTLGNSMAAMKSELDTQQREFVERNGDALRVVEMQHSVERSEPGAPPSQGGDRVQARADAPEILICEDNADMRRLLRDLVGQEFRVRLASDGREGLERVRERAPDLVLTDVMMPEMSGSELCRRLKSDPKTWGIPVVLVTSKAERQMKIEGLEGGADDYVTKPFHPRELLARIRSLVKLRRLQAELEIGNALLESSNTELAATLQELREAGVQLARAERLSAVGELAAGIAHEVNNPMNFAINALRALRGYVEDVLQVAERVGEIDSSDTGTLQAHLIGLEKLKEKLEFANVTDSLGELVDIVEEGLGRTQKLVGDLRDFAAPGEERRADLDLVRGLRSTVQLVSHAFRDAGAELHLDLPERLPTLTGESRALNQVFLNLLKNAAEALEGRGGSAWLEARHEDGEILVRVRDDGPGIPREELARVFEPFYSTKEPGRGTGLGLSISRRILADHGGSLDVVSEPGRGTTFTVRIPLQGDPRET